MRKAVAVPYVIALILGVAVIALLGIWFVMTGGKFSKQSLETQCQSKIIEYCSRYVSTGNEPSKPSECDNAPLPAGFSFGDLAKCKTQLGIS